MVALTAAMTADAALSATIRAAVGDMFADRILVGSLPYAESIDLSSATTQTGEVLDSMTRTVWREVSQGDLLRLRVTVSGTNPRLGVWRQTAASMAAAPAISNLERVGGIGQSALTLDLDPSWPAYYLQVGVTAGTGSDVSILVEDASPPEGGTFGTALDVYGVPGWASVDTSNAVQEAGEPDPTGMSPTATAWLAWYSPADPPGMVRFDLPSTGTVGQVGLGVYTGSAVGALTKITDGVAPAADGVAVEFAPSPNTLYYIQVATGGNDGQYEVRWYVPAEQGELQVPAEPFDYLRVEVYDKDGVTKVSEIKDRLGVVGSEPLNVPGNGSITVPLDSPLLNAYPGLLKPGRFVKFFLGSKCISGFRIQHRQSVWVSSGEYAGMVLTVSGPTVHYLLSDFVTHHDVWPPRPDSPDTRYYSWASRPGEGADRWYDPDDWDAHINVNSQSDPPGDWKSPPTKRSKYGMPKKWPDPDSMWMWISRSPSMNGGWDPPRPIAGRKYYRRDFVVNQATDIRMFVTSDETVIVYLDGDEVIRKESRENGYKTFTKLSTRVSKGVHTIGIFVHAARGQSGGDGNDAMMFTMYKLNKDGKRDGVILRSNRQWQAYYGRGVPAWNRAQVLKNSIQEARDRENTAADQLVLGFDGIEDSEGKAWDDRFNQEVRIGTSGLDLQSQLSESGSFDVWVDPDDLKVRAWRRRGKDRSKSVALIPGVNLLDYAAESRDDVGNDFLIQYDRGFTKVSAPGSIRANGAREVYVELGGVRDEDTAQDVIRNAISAFRDFRKRSGSPEVVLRARSERDGSLIGVPGAYPFLDYNTGDVVSAPDEDGRMVPHRVMSLAFVEDADGNLAFDPDLEQVAPPEPIGESL